MLFGMSTYFTPRGVWDIRVVMILVTAIVIVGSSLLSQGPWVGKRGLLILGVLHFALGCWTVALSPRPLIDVWLFHQDSAAAILHGINPYSITFQNMYLNRDGSPSIFYSLDVQQDGRVMFGFPYPPLSMWMYLPSYILTGESRYAHALAMTLSGVLVATLSTGRLGKAAGVLLLTAPGTWQVISCAWTEPFLLLTLVLVAVAAIRWPALLPVALGLFLGMKQYTVIFLPLVFLLLPRPLCWRTSARFLGLMVFTGAIVSLPLALWDWQAFWHSVVTIQVLQPFRYDAMSFLALIANAYPNDPPPASWIPFALLVPTWVVLLWRLPRNISGFVLGVVGTMIVFLFTNRQAFMNYHSLAAGGMLLYVAVFERTAKNDAAVRDPTAD